MPELPEVETIVRQLKPSLEGEVFVDFHSSSPSSFFPLGDLFKKRLLDKKIERLHRRGKYLIFDLKGVNKLVIHLRMTGMLSLAPLKGKEKFVRGVFSFQSGKKLYFSDIRRFGKVVLCELDKSGVEKLGVDPVVDGLSAKDVKRLFYRKKGILKNKLLDQGLIAGIGNIYADEICFRSGLRPETRLEKLTTDDCRRLHEAILFCLEEGIRNNGTTISDFVDSNGQGGNNQEVLRVYGRAGKPCLKCGSLIKKTRAAGRGTYYCEKCQH